MGLAVMTELPLVIVVNVQRGGPSAPACPPRPSKPDLPPGDVRPQRRVRPCRFWRRPHRATVSTSPSMRCRHRGALHDSGGRAHRWLPGQRRSEPWKHSGAVEELDRHPACPSSPTAENGKEFQRLRAQRATRWRVLGPFLARTGHAAPRGRTRESLDVTGNVSATTRPTTSKHGAICAPSKVARHRPGHSATWSSTAPSRGDLLHVGVGFGTYGAHHARPPSELQRAGSGSVSHAHLRHLNPFPSQHWATSWRSFEKRAHS